MESQKDKGKKFLEMIAANKVAEAFDTYTSKLFRHHSPYYKSDRASFQKGLEEFGLKMPILKFEAKQVFEDGSFVILHSLLTFKASPSVVVVHVLRFEQGLIAEFWDVGMALPENPVNSAF